MCEKDGCEGIAKANWVSDTAWGSVRHGRPLTMTPNMVVVFVLPRREELVVGG